MNSLRTGLFQKFAEGYVRVTSRHPWRSLAVLALFTAVMAVLAAQIKIRTDLRLLLPASASSVQALGLSEQRLGSTDFFTIAFEDSSAEKVGRFQRALADSMGGWKESQWVQYDEDRRFFERHALMYLPADQLRDLEARLHSMAEASKSFNPFAVDLMKDGPAAPASLEGWPNRQVLYKQGIPMDVVEGLLERLDKESGSHAAQSSNPNGSASPSLPDSLQDRMIGWHAEKRVWVGVVIAQLRIPSTEASFASLAKARGENLSANVQRALNLHLHSAVVGAYRDPSSEIEEINTDMWIASTVAMVLILALLFYYMRRPANVAVVFVPLLVAMVWMMGAAQIVYGRLTVLTSFVLALLSGLGIEYGIHIYSRWMEERRAGHSPETAMSTSLAKSGRSLVSAMAASITCMLAFQVGHFQGFKEFGIVVSLGIFLAFLASVLVLPPLLFAFLRVGRVAADKGRFLRWLVPSEEYSGGAELVPSLTWSKAFLRGAFVVSMVITVAMMAAPKVEFENDFDHLRGGKGHFEWISKHMAAWTKGLGAKAKAEDQISYGRAVGQGRNTTPSLILAQSEAQTREIHDTLGARFGGEADTMLKSFVTVQSFLPRPEVQRERLTILENIRNFLDSEDFSKASVDQKARLATLRRFTVCDSFGFDSLPPYARHFLTEADGSHGKFGFIYSEMEESNAVESRKFQLRNGQFVTSTGIVPVASSGFIYADVVQLVKEDVGRLALAVFLFLGIVVWIDTRSWRGLLVNLGYIGLIALWTYGAMGWLGLKLGLFNVVMLPALLSNTVDATIHLFHRRMESGAGKIGEIYHTAGSSVLAGTLTNAFGFLALLVVAHQGLNTIGLLACLGYSAGILIMFLTMPFLLEVVCPKEPQQGSGEA